MSRINWDFVLGAAWAGCLGYVCKNVYDEGKRKGRLEACRDMKDALTDVILNVESKDTDEEEEI